MVLNMLSTGAMTRLGYVYGNLMVNVHLKNQKLVERGVSVLQEAAGTTRKAARRALKNAGNSLPVALVMLRANAGRADAQGALQAVGGNVRLAVAAARNSRGWTN